MDIQNHFFKHKSAYIKKPKTSYFQWFPAFSVISKSKAYVDYILSDTFYNAIKFQWTNFPVAFSCSILVAILVSIDAFY